jgi:hypothetical protein
MSHASSPLRRTDRSKIIKRGPKGGKSSPDPTGLRFHPKSLLRGQVEEDSTKAPPRRSDAHRRHRHRPNKVGRAFAQSCLTTTPRNRPELQLARTPLIWLTRNHHTKATAFLVIDRSRRAPTPAEGLVSTPASATPYGDEDGQHQSATNQATPRQLGTPTKHHREEAPAGTDPVPGAESRRPQVHSPDLTAEPPPRPPRPPNHPEVPGLPH